MAAGRFKDRCLRTLDEVARTRSTIVITKRRRLIVATARDRDAAIVTRDRTIRGYGHVRSIW